MDKQTLQKEIDEKRSIAVKDFDELLAPGVIGYYKSCEITQVFLENTATQSIHNFYSVICFSDSELNPEKKYLTKSPATISSIYKFGIVRHRVALNSAREIFENLLDGNFELDGTAAHVSPKLILLPKQFVPNLWGGSSPALMSVLKRNFYGDNYVIEFFDEHKTLLKELSRNEVDLIYAKIKECDEINLGFHDVYDRTCGIIFQFPITVLSTDCNLIRNSNHVLLKLNRHPVLKDTIPLTVVVKTTLDENVTGFRSLETTSDNRELELLVADSNSLEIYVARKDSSILFHHSQYHFLRHMSTTMQFGMEGAEPRRFKPRDAATEVEIHVTDPMPMDSGWRHREEYSERIDRRIREKEIIQNSGDYGVFNNDKVGALNFLRNKLNGTMRLREICLWDPFLKVQDIVDVLYFESSQRMFRCITSNEAMKTISVSFDDDSLPLAKASDKKFQLRRAQQLQTICDISNNLGVRLDFRCARGGHGYGFHDRFLILVPAHEEELPVVFSLGSSVNNIGDAHTMIQKVTNPRVILNNFNQLWDALDPGRCRILLLPDDLRGGSR